MKKQLLTAVTIFLIFTANAQWQNENANFINDTLGFYEMSLPNQHTAWAVCYDGKAGLNNGRFILDFTRTTDRGVTWTPGKMGNDHTLQFSNISAINENEAWVAMNKRYLTGGGLYHTTNGGITWQQAGVGEVFDANSFPNFVYFKDKNHGVTMGDPNGGYFEVYTTNNKGKKWKRVSQSHLPPVLTNEYGWISGFAVTGNIIWFGTSAGRMYKSTNFGKDWTVATVDPAGKMVYEIAFNDDMQHGVSHLRDNLGQTFLYSTVDGGFNWTNLGQPAQWKSSRITSVPGTNALIATSVNSFDRGSSISYDNGSTWTEIENSTPKAVARFYDAHTGYAGGYFVTGPPLRGGIYKSQISFQVPLCGKPNASDRNISSQEEKITATELIKVYPSPADECINITLPQEFKNSQCVINIITSDGKIIRSRKFDRATFIQLNVRELPSGIYLLRLEINGKTITKPITIYR